MTRRTATKRIEERTSAPIDPAQQFLRLMSHEMRTPLNGVIGMINLLQRTRLDGAQRAYAENARHVSQLHVPDWASTPPSRSRNAARVGHLWLPHTNRPQLDKGRNMGGGGTRFTSICDVAGSHRAFRSRDTRKTSNKASTARCMG